MKGRKPTPTHLKVVNGNPGKRAIPDATPQPTVEMIPPPDYLDDDARRVWNDLSDELFRLGLMSRLDVPFLAAFCIATAEAVRAYEDLKTNGRIYETEGRNGRLRKSSPAVAQFHEALRNMRSLGSEFGLSPASRVRLVGVAQGDLFAPGGPGSDNDFAEFA